MGRLIGTLITFILAAALAKPLDALASRHIDTIRESVNWVADGGIQSAACEIFRKFGE